MPSHFSFDLKRKEPFTEKVNGVTISLPAYDIPEEIRGWEDGSGILHIQFRYCDDEPAGGAEELPNGTSVVRGQYSEKILEIHLPVKKFAVSEVKIQINVLSDNLSQPQGDMPWSAKGNQHMVSDYLSDNAVKIATLASQ